MSEPTIEEEGGFDIPVVCLPRAVAPEIVPVILAFLYTDRLETNPENGPDGCAETYTEPGGGKGWAGREDEAEVAVSDGRGAAGSGEGGRGSMNGPDEVRCWSRVCSSTY